MNTADDLKGLTPDDLKLQGSFYTNEMPLRFEDAGSAVRIMPPKFLGSLLATCVLFLAFFAGSWVIVDRYLPRITETDKIVFKTAIVIIGIFTIGGYSAFIWLRHRYLARRSPLLEYDKNSRRVSIHNGRRSFSADVVVCLLALTTRRIVGRDRSLNTELVLVVNVGDKRERILIVTSASGSKKTFDNVLIPFQAATGLRTLKARSGGLFRAAPFTVREIK